MKFHRVAMTDNIAGSTWVMICLPNTSIIVQLVQNSKVLIRNHLFLDQECSNCDSAHPSTYNNTKFVFCLHAHLEVVSDFVLGLFENRVSGLVDINYLPPFGLGSHKTEKAAIRGPHIHCGVANEPSLRNKTI